MKRKLFGTVKDHMGVRFYFFGLKLYEERKLPHSRKTYVLGVKVKKKNYVKIAESSPATLSMQKKIEWKNRLAAAEQKILTLGLYYKDLPIEQRYILCFDFLGNPRTEAIDAWTFFQYLQEKNIPSKYVLLRQNPLYKKLQEENRLEDILAVNGEMQLLTDYPDVIAQSRLVVCSFSFELSRIFKELPFLRYVFIEHGVTLLKDWSIEHYDANSFDGKLVPTTLTKQFYEQKGISSRNLTQYYCGMPRWDLLKPANHSNNEKKIFLFFTYRGSFSQSRQLRMEYISRIRSFVNRLRQELQDNVQLYLSLHHLLFLQDRDFKGLDMFEGVNLVPTTEISKMVREADMCITDYSSIGFDFLYRDVPTIFFCFDADINYPGKNDKVSQLADSVEKWLYNCCRDADTAVSMVKNYEKRGFVLEPEYASKNREIFWNRGNNCELLLQLLNK